MNSSALLVLDDEPDFGGFVGRVATQLGYDVTVLSDPRLFKETYQSTNPAVIVLDVVMPEIDGIELVEWMVQQGSKARVLMVTGFNPSYAKAAEILGTVKGRLSVTTLNKPVQVSELRDALGTPGA